MAPGVLSQPSTHFRIARPPSTARATTVPRAGHGRRGSAAGADGAMGAGGGSDGGAAGAGGGIGADGCSTTGGGGSDAGTTPARAARRSRVRSVVVSGETCPPAKNGGSPLPTQSAASAMSSAAIVRSVSSSAARWRARPGTSPRSPPRDTVQAICLQSGPDSASAARRYCSYRPSRSGRNTDGYAAIHATMPSPSSMSGRSPMACANHCVTAAGASSGSTWVSCVSGSRDPEARGVMKPGGSPSAQAGRSGAGALGASMPSASASAAARGSRERASRIVERASPVEACSASISGATSAGSRVPSSITAADAILDAS